MKDKNGTEITNECYIRIKYLYGEDSLKMEGIYQVFLNPFWGMKADLIAANKEAVPYFSVKEDEFAPDLVDTKRIAITKQTFKDRDGNHIMKQHYSNDIEVVELF